MRIIAIHIACLLLSSGLFSQMDKLMEDLSTSQEAIVDMLPLKVSTDYTLYATHDTLEAMSTAYAETYLSHKSYYQHIEGVHTFIEGTIVVIVDEEENTIVYDQKEVDISDLLFNLDLDHIEGIVQSVEYTESNSNKNYTLLLQPLSGYSKIELQISKRTQLIERLHLFYAHSQGLENTLQEEETPRLMTEIEMVSIGRLRPYSLQQNPFYNFVEGKIVAQEPYQDFHIINSIVN